MLVSVDPAAFCVLPSGLVLGPLPARKQLWEASNEHQWRSECAHDGNTDSAFGLAANGELVRLNEFYKSKGDASSPNSAINWEQWCSGMDGFGSLIMLTASLL